MRNLYVLLAALCSPLVLADAQLKVEANTLLRLPATTSTLLLDRLEIAEHGTLLIPANLNEIRVAELVLGRDAHIGIAPSEQAFRLDVAAGRIDAGSHISARGAPGTELTPPSAGRSLSLRLENLTLAGELSLDARGGKGAPGYSGLGGGAGEAAGCLWGRASRGHDGQNGGDGSVGAAGARVRLEVARNFPVELIQVRLDGGAGGPAGVGGDAGPGGAGKGCLFYRAAGGKAGRPGSPGQAGAAGPSGSLDVVRFE